MNLTKFFNRIRNRIVGKPKPANLPDYEDDYLFAFLNTPFKMDDILIIRKVMQDRELSVLHVGDGKGGERGVFYKK